MNITLVDPGARANRCDIAASRFARFDREGYFTIDANWIVPALCIRRRLRAQYWSLPPAAAI